MKEYLITSILVAGIVVVVGVVALTAIGIYCIVKHDKAKKAERKRKEQEERYYEIDIL